ncbi:MAG: NERD domain-containing protein, partial [Candidatus Nanopelagicales bacterium]
MINRAEASQLPLAGAGEYFKGGFNQMVQFFPSSGLPNGAPKSEQLVYEALKKLPAHWVVIHSLGLHVWGSRFAHDGEADFVLLSPKAGLLLLEAKGGR